MTDTANNWLAGKKGLIMGVANDRSIAWGIAQAARNAGAELAFTYQGEALEKRVKPLADSIGSTIVLPCDVTNADSVSAVFDTIGEKWGGLDFVVHAIAFSDKNELDGLYLNTTRDNFLKTMDISVYSFTSVAQKAAPRLCHVRQAPSGHDGHLQKIAAVATFRRFRHQPVRLAHGSSGFAGKPRAYCPAVTLLALAAAYITPHYAPLPASVATLLSPATVRASPRIAGVMQTWLLQPARQPAPVLSIGDCGAQRPQCQSHELRSRHVPSRALRAALATVFRRRAPRPGAGHVPPPTRRVCLRRLALRCSAVTTLRLGSPATHPPQGAPPTEKQHRSRACQKLQEYAGSLAAQAFARLAMPMQNALHTAIRPFASPDFSGRTEA